MSVDNQPSLTRRQFLFLSGVSAIGATLSSCGPESEQKNPDQLEEMLRKEIKALPDSALKKLLETRVLPFFSGPYPKIVDYGGVKVPFGKPLLVHNLITQRGELIAEGHFTPRKETVSRAYFPLKDEIAKVPLIGMMAPQEIQIVPAGNRINRPGGGVLVDVIFEQRDAIYEGGRPEISVSIQSKNIVKPEYYAKLPFIERFTLMKELMGLFLIDTIYQTTASEMKRLNLPTTLRAKNIDGETFDVELLSQAFTVFSDNGGRFVAAVDLAAYILTINMYRSNKDMLNAISVDETFKKAINSATTEKFEGSAEQIYISALQAVITNRTYREFIKSGTMNKFPRNFISPLNTQLAMAGSLK